MTDNRTDILLQGQLPSPIGAVALFWEPDETLRAIDFADNEDRLARLIRLHCGTPKHRRAPVPTAIRDAFARYFAGDGAALTGLAWRTGGTAFQHRVWRYLEQIPAGAIRRYGEVAAALGRPAAARAVGHANGANPLSILLPCHRLVGADGRLTGYAGGLTRKRWLLLHEGVNPDGIGRRVVSTGG